MSFNKQSIVQQHDSNDCGVAALMTILNSHRIKAEYHDVKQIMLENGGDTLKAIKSTSEKYGLHGAAYCSDNRNPFDLLKLPNPSIVRIIKHGHYHYVVFIKISNSMIYYADPAIGDIQSQTISNFKSVFTGYIISFQKDSKKSIVQNFDNNNSYKATEKVLYNNLLTQNKSILLFLIVLSALVSIISVSSSYFIKMLTDYCIPEKNANLIIIFGIGFLIVKLTGEFFDYIRIRSLNTFVVKNKSIILSEYTHQMISLPFRFFEKRKSGDILNKLKCSEEVIDMLALKLIRRNYDIIYILLLNAFSLLYSIVLGISIVLVEVSVYLMMNSIKKRLTTSSKALFERRSILDSELIQTIGLVSTIKCFNSCEAVAIHDKNEINDYYKSINIFQNRTNNSHFLISVFVNTALVVMICFSSYEVICSKITLGTFVMFVSLIQMSLNPVLDLVNIQPEIISGQQALVKLCAFNESKDQIQNDLTQNNCTDALYSNFIIKKIELKNVCFSYSNNVKLLDKVNVVFESNSINSIVGLNGCGKSTIGKMLVGIINPKSGKIYYNGISADKLSNHMIRQHVIYVEQEPKLINASIYDNIRFFDDKITDDSIDNLIDSLSILEFINTMPEKKQTIINENGRNLSGGQKQLICLARALIRKPDVLILDEITSNLDQTLEASFVNLITELKKHTTIINISHKENIIKASDNIYMIRDGSLEIVSSS